MTMIDELRGLAAKCRKAMQSLPQNISMQAEVDALVTAIERFAEKPLLIEYEAAPLRARIAELEQQVASLQQVRPKVVDLLAAHEQKAPAAQAIMALHAARELLAVIHHDGGQRVEEVGFLKACAEAQHIVVTERASIDALTAECDEVLDAIRAVASLSPGEEPARELPINSALDAVLALKKERDEFYRNAAAAISTCVAIRDRDRLERTLVNSDELIDAAMDNNKLLSAENDVLKAELADLKLALKNREDDLRGARHEAGRYAAEAAELRQEFSSIVLRKDSKATEAIRAAMGLLVVVHGDARHLSPEIGFVRACDEAKAEVKNLRDRIASLEGGIVAENRRVTARIDALVAAGDALAKHALLKYQEPSLEAWEKAKND